MIESLRKELQRYQVILVSGPQRSGTRIAAKILAADLDYAYIDENEIKVDSLNALCKIVKIDGCKVIQCPALSRYVHFLASQDIAAVFMMRDVDDIIASQGRIGWESELPELLRYGRLAGEPAKIKYHMWARSGHLLQHCFELQYLDLRGHELWIDKEHRKNFGPLQTTNDDPNHSSDAE